MIIIIIYYKPLITHIYISLPSLKLIRTRQNNNIMEGNKLLNGMIYTGAFTLLRKAQTVYKITYFCYTCWFLQTGNGGSKHN